METFNGISVVKVIDKDSPLFGKTGRVVRVLISTSTEAWVEMDEPIPDTLRRFPKSDSRGNHVLLYADQCSPVKS